MGEGCCSKGKCSSQQESAAQRLKRTFSEKVEQVGVHLRALRLRLAFFCILPMTASLFVCHLAGEPVFWALQLVLELATISACFSAFYDTLSQFSEAMYRRHQSKEDIGICEAFWKRYDFWRTVRYSGIHFVYNGPYHMPKLLFLNWMYPGTPDTSIAMHKWMWATFVFSPGESFGVLSGVQIMRDQGGISNVPAKLRADFFQFQMTKWVGHAIPHYLSFLSAESVIGIYTANFAMKTVFELFLSFVAARPVRNKSEFKRDYAPVGGDEEQPLDEKTKPSAYSTI